MFKSVLNKIGVYPAIKRKILLQTKCKFTDRSFGANTVILILAGYKSFLWEIVFKRIKAFAPANADVCIVSSGLYSTELEKIAETNHWSYLSTKKNNVCIALNVAITHFSAAEFIYKIDEDIFVTKHFFSNTMQACLDTQKEGSFYQKPVFIAPLIPINHFGYAYILKYLDLENEFASRFEPVHIGANAKVTSDIEAAKFMWGEGGIVPKIDQIDDKLSQAHHGLLTCPIRFSIGAILIRRNVWEEMGYFTGWRGNGMGADEIQLCKYAVIASYPMVITADTCVGHLSFGAQNKAMKAYFLENKACFSLDED